jgi:hypothetical protein
MRQLIGGLILVSLAFGALTGCVVVPSPPGVPPGPVYERPPQECRWVRMDGYWAGGRWIEPRWECRRP